MSESKGFFSFFGYGSNKKPSTTSNTTKIPDKRPVSRNSTPKPGSIVKIRGASFPIPLIAVDEATKRSNSYDGESENDASVAHAKEMSASSSMPLHGGDSGISGSSSAGAVLGGGAAADGSQLRKSITISPSTAVGQILFSESNSKTEKLRRLLSEPIINIDALRKASWSGIPSEVRPMIWRLLTGYLPCNSEGRQATLERKRKEYLEFVPQYYNSKSLSKTEYEIKMQQQIYIDVIRTHPDVQLFRHPRIQQSLERILYIWAIRHPASGYVQGINDLVTPFLTVFLQHLLLESSLAATTNGNSSSSNNNSIPIGNGQDLLAVMNTDPDIFSEEAYNTAEADSYWCTSKMLDFIQDNYTCDQPGIQRMVHKLEEIILRIDAPLYHHMEKQGIQFIQFSFRWMNCLLMRELPLRLVVRMLDTYLAEGDDFGALHVYVCAAFLKNFSERLKNMEFGEMMMFIQHLPTKDWTYKEIELLLSQAYMLKELYDGSLKM